MSSTRCWHFARQMLHTTGLEPSGITGKGQVVEGLLPIGHV